MATLSALSSCVVGPNYVAPRISLTAFHSTAPDNQETSGVRPKLDTWWADFHDSLLTQTIQEALAQNLDLAASLDRVEQARAASLAQYRQSVLRVAEDVENALTTYVQVEAQQHIVEREIEALKRVPDTSEEAYERGAIALTDVLDADWQLLAAQDELVRTRVDAARAVVASYRAIGGSWQAPLT